MFCFLSLSGQFCPLTRLLSLSCNISLGLCWYRFLNFAEIYPWLLPASRILHFSAKPSSVGSLLNQQLLALNISLYNWTNCMFWFQNNDSKLNWNQGENVFSTPSVFIETICLPLAWCPAVAKKVSKMLDWRETRHKKDKFCLIFGHSYKNMQWSCLKILCVWMGFLLLNKYTLKLEDFQNRRNKVIKAM